ncbi:MAG TPA: 5'-methylthioadenosine/S-adenosylhomocysteine nucleosidase [Candidatus Acidoferrum sp.]|nr:5'-methylthioadenosine/S-adenosylhomocysteine nucleosidase [Candidatus Acidoferrum sp.]
MEPAVRPVALFAALDAEARALVRHLTPSTRPSPQLSIWAGVIEGTPAVLVVTGVGKVAAALAAQFVCDSFHPRCAITFGLAGATRSDVRPGHLIVASGAVQHDMDARPLTDARGTIPSLGMTVLASDPTLSEKLRRAANSVVDNPTLVTSGLVLTGDQIVTSREVRAGVLQEFPEGACFDMETAAIAQVAIQNGMPWAALRMTSDAADETFNLDQVIGFGIDTAAGRFEQVVRALLKDFLT